MNTNDWQIPEYKTIELKTISTDYCVCIPVINEGDRIRSELQMIFNQRIPELADVIICDGGSTDNSLDIDFLKKIKVSALLIKTGPGKLSAQLRMGYSYILEKGYKGIVTIDGNNKDNVDAIPLFIKELEAGFDFIQGSRYLSGGKAINTPLMRVLSIKLIHNPIISILAGFKYTDTTNGYRGYSRRLLLDEGISPFRDVFNKYELLSYLSVKSPRLGYRVKEIPVIRSYPKGEKVPTKISPIKGKLEYLLILLKLIFKQFDVNGRK